MNRNAGGPQLVLVVDDDWMSREVMEVQLKLAGYEVLTAHNGEKALKIAFERPPDLVLLDVRMEGITGYEVCAKLKSNEATRFTPVIIVTALESDEDKLRAINMGADDFMSKPFTSLMLLTRVKNLLRLKRLHDELEERNALLRRVLNRYVNDNLTEIILSDPEKHLQLGGETRPVTVFFADIRGFTAFAEQHRAGDVLALLNHFFNELTEIIFHNQGTFDKYIGDSIMAFFGAPVVGENDALNAARAAMEMQSMFARLKRSVSHLDIQDLGLGIGLHSGDAAVGNVGSERVMSYTVIGDTVNTAYRLEQVAESGMTLMSTATYRLLQEYIYAQPLSPIPLKGKRDPQMVYSLIGLK